LTTETIFRLAFVFLLAGLLAMRFYFMIKVRRSGGRLMPDEKAVAREGGRGVLIIRVVGFFALVTFLVMYIIRMPWIDMYSFPLPNWLRWAGFALGVVTVAFWTWTQITLDTQWSAQLQLTKNHHLVTTGPYAWLRHPLYAGMFGWSFALALLTANWIFVAVCLLVFLGLLWRIPREEKMMLEAFGDEYKTYMQRTGRFFPRLRK
jgi:protein-S-isoprenylcysteine O-methyltransferase Ste14